MNALGIVTACFVFVTVVSGHRKTSIKSTPLTSPARIRKVATAPGTNRRGAPATTFLRGLRKWTSEAAKLVHRCLYRQLLILTDPTAED